MVFFEFNGFFVSVFSCFTQTVLLASFASLRVDEDLLSIEYEKAYQFSSFFAFLCNSAHINLLNITVYSIRAQIIYFSINAFIIIKFDSALLLFHAVFSLPVLLHTFFFTINKYLILPSVFPIFYFTLSLKKAFLYLLII